MSEKLTDKKCKPCEGGTPPLKGNDLEDMIAQLPAGWQVEDQHHLIKTFKFDDFRQALDFTNKVGEIAEDEGHHPDIYLTYGQVDIKMWTHKIDGLTESDFIFAAKADAACGDHN